MGKINVPALLRVAIAMVAILVVAVLIFVFVQQRTTEPTVDPVEIGATPTDLAQLDRFGITVQGEAERSVEPDHAIVSLGVEAVGDSSNEATTQLGVISNQIVDAVSAAGVADADIQTSGLSLWPVYGDTSQVQQATILGYRASANYRITVREIDSVAAVVDAGLEAGANSIEGISFDSTEIESVREELLGEAARESARKAESIALALGGDLGGLIWLEEQYYSQPIAARGGQFEIAAASAAGPAVAAGTLTVTVQVRANFSFERG